MLRLVAAVTFALVLVGVTPEARADDATASAASSDVETMVRRGVDLRRAHKNEEALDAFKRAFARSPTLRIRAQVALAEQALGHWLDAEAELSTVLATAADPWVTRNREALESARATVEEHLGWLAVDVAVVGAVVRVDGEPIPIGEERRVAAGSRVLEVRAEGYVPEARRINVAPGLHSRIAMSLLPLSDVATDPPGSPERAPHDVDANRDRAIAVGDAERAKSPSAAVPIGLGALGIAGVGVGTYFGIHAMNEKNARDALCPQRSPCPPEALEHHENARSAATISTIAFGVGAAAILGDVAWLLLHRKRSPERTSIRIAPAVGPGVAGLFVGGTL